MSKFTVDAIRVERQLSALEQSFFDHTPESPGYHLVEIPRGVYGDSSKLMEEVQEIQDAENQGSKVMVLVELSDLVGAIKGMLDKHFPGIQLSDLEKMSVITDRAFTNGHRQSK